MIDLERLYELVKAVENDAYYAGIYDGEQIKLAPESEEFSKAYAEAEKHKKSCKEAMATIMERLGIKEKK